MAARASQLRRPSLTPDSVRPMLSRELAEEPAHHVRPHAATPQRTESWVMTSEFGLARGIDVQAFGQPGQRTFRLRIVGSGSETASIWLEKEQLQALSLALRQMLSQLEYDQEPPAAGVGEFPVTADHDFRAGRLGMGFQPDDRTVVLLTYEIGATEDDDDPTLRMRLSQEQSASLILNLDEIIAGGRPTCPLCGAPVEASGHACIRSNGHSKQPIPDEHAGEDDA